MRLTRCALAESLLADAPLMGRAAVAAYDRAKAAAPDDDEGKMIEIVSRPKDGKAEIGSFDAFSLREPVPTSLENALFASHQIFASALVLFESTTFRGLVLALRFAADPFIRRGGSS